MQMNKNDLLGALKNIKVDNGPTENTSFKKTDFLKEIGNFMPKADGKGKLLDDANKKLNTDLAEPESEIKFESTWKPQPSDIKAISKKLLVESAILENSSPNAFRLDLASLVLDKTHAKMGMTRGGEAVHIDLMYPNANGKITVKLSTEGLDDKIYELSLEDEAYVGNFGASLLKEIDGMLAEKKSMGLGDYDDEYYIGNKSGGLTGFAPTWEAGNNAMESAVSRMSDLMTMVEADETDDEEDLGLEDAEAGEDALDAEAGDVNSEFSEADFSLDDEVDMGEFDDLSGNLAGGDLGGGIGGGEAEGGDVNDTGSDFAVEEDVNYLTFREKSDWLNSALDTMLKLVSQSVGDKMQDGEGVILTSDEILNGTVGIKNDSNAEVIDKFLKVYPSLDAIELKETDLNRIEEKLTLDDGQFDAWLQAELPEMRGDSDVSDALDNEMFAEFEPMGGEEKEDFDGLGEFDEFIDATTSDEGDVEGFDAAESEAEAEAEADELRAEAEDEIEDKELNEFPNV